MKGYKLVRRHFFAGIGRALGFAFIYALIAGVLYLSGFTLEVNKFPPGITEITKTK